MPPTVILIRHAEALHNRPDPPLSELGLKQCKALREHLQTQLPLAQEIELIVVSPLRRTLQTATIALDWLIERGVPVVPDAYWQENSDKPCDTGSPIPVISREFERINFSALDRSFPEKIQPPSNPYAFTRRAVLARGQRCLEWLHARPEKVVAVVSHSGFLRCAVSRSRYANADYRVFDFVDGGKGPSGEFELVEWKSTAESGGGMGKSDKGRAEIEEGDFPPEEVLEKMKQEHGERAEGEPVREVPK